MRVEASYGVPPRPPATRLLPNPGRDETHRGVLYAVPTSGCSRRHFRWLTESSRRLGTARSHTCVVAVPFDVSDLPASFREQLHALNEGDEISLIEDGRAVATVVAGQRVMVGLVLPTQPDADRQPPSRPGLKVVATGMKVTEQVRAYLSLALGDEYVVVDIKRAPETVDALLVPPLSAQALTILRNQSPLPASL
jgi:antitoxin (DNA-binding transcriptional repressor) of toxin-antitoxin stability system